MRKTVGEMVSQKVTKFIAFDSRNVFLTTAADERFWFTCEYFKILELDICIDDGAPKVQKPHSRQQQIAKTKYETGIHRTGVEDIIAGDPLPAEPEYRFLI